jgi:hypothetical protein
VTGHFVMEDLPEVAFIDSLSTRSADIKMLSFILGVAVETLAPHLTRFDESHTQFFESFGNGRELFHTM